MFEKDWEPLPWNDEMEIIRLQTAEILAQNMSKINGYVLRVFSFNGVCAKFDKNIILQ